MQPRWLRAVGLSCLFAAVAQATVVVSQSIEEMARSAPLVVRGTVGQVQARWGEDRRIWTYAEIRVEESLKGTAPAVLLVRQPGGVIGDIGMRVFGAAQFKTGEQVLLFLESPPDEPNVFHPMGLSAGKVSFEKSKVGEVRAVRDLRGLAFYERGEEPRVRIVEDGLEDLGTPEQLLAQVKAALKGVQP